MRLFTLLGLLLAASLLSFDLSAQSDCHCTIQKQNNQLVYSQGCFPADRNAKLCALTLKDGVGNIDLYHLEDLRGVIITVEKNVNARFEGTALSSSSTRFIFPDGGTQIKIRDGANHISVASENNGNGANSVSMYNQQLQQCSGACTLLNPAQAAVMPVTLTSWETQARNGQVELHWETAAEKDNSHFQVSHSTDGRSFRTLATVAGQGDSEQLNSYHYRHLPARDGVNYYRLEQFDYDGTRTELGVQSVNFSGAEASVLSISPNPVKAGAELRVDLADAAGTEVQLYGPAGRLIGAYVLNHSTFQLPQLSAGIYTLRIGQRAARIVVTP
ncbi:hypothetical protein GGR26_000146 [Lewinella marina]|uniref:Secretion system C-terminal sorting domain-containing protein n=1 Tax=Neolewinella marina TaxID=438751 RepID=A0A2G0CKA0_9BACT|nr:T9SS type A sorting domain-containing protein [Neolewinella marina]NJB84401.1 hypothetical protein [Neolewinella marina]PHL00404.1 hypothetical protein CGL56_05055 [Neolewinella marina]